MAGRTNGLPNGSYKAVFTLASLHCRSATSDVIDAEGSPIDGIDASLDNKGQATGKVVDSDGVGIEGVTVSVLLPPAYSVVNTGTTDAQGNYQVWVDNAEPGDNTSYVMSFASSDGSYQERWSGGSSDQLDAGGVTINDDQGDQDPVTLPDATTITGTITDPDNNPIAGASVTAYDPDGVVPSSATVTTDAGGNYSIGGLDATDYNVQVIAPGHFYTGDTLDADLTTATTIDVDAQLAENGDIPGTVSVAKTNFDKQLDHVMEVGGAISGTITTLNDSSHLPEEVIVTATSTTSSFSKYIFVTPATGLTSTYALDAVLRLRSA